MLNFFEAILTTRKCTHPVHSYVNITIQFYPDYRHGKSLQFLRYELGEVQLNTQPVAFCSKIKQRRTKQTT